MGRARPMPLSCGVYVGGIAAGSTGARLTLEIKDASSITLTEDVSFAMADVTYVFCGGSSDIGGSDEVLLELAGEGTSRQYKAKQEDEQTIIAACYDGDDSADLSWVIKFEKK